MNNEHLQVVGEFTGTLIHKDGRVETFKKHNLILNQGIDFICDVIGNPTRPDRMSYIAVGSGNTPPEPTDTKLGSEITRIQSTFNHRTGDKYFTLTATFNAGVGTGAITEAGICNLSVGGRFLDRVTFPVVNKGADDIYTITFTITFSV